MRILKVTEVPKCDLCDQPAHCDAPTESGAWAFMCKAHHKTHGSERTDVGSIFEKIPSGTRS